MTTLFEEKHDESRHEIVEFRSKEDSNFAKIAADNDQERSLTLALVARNHPKLLFWSFFWCLTAVGWGFDTQVNGAMISVPAFRAYYGQVVPCASPNHLLITLQILLQRRACPWRQLADRIQRGQLGWPVLRRLRLQLDLGSHRQKEGFGHWSHHLHRRSLWRDICSFCCSVRRLQADPGRRSRLLPHTWTHHLQ